MTLPGTTLEEEFRRRNAPINGVAAYCEFQEGGATARSRGRPPTRKASPIPAKEAWHQSIRHSKAISLPGEETNDLFSLSRQPKFANEQAYPFL